MSHPVLASLTLAESHERGRNARRMGLPYFIANPFASDLSIESLEECAAKSMAWYAGWLEQDAGCTEAVRNHRRGELAWLAGRGYGL